MLNSLKKISSIQFARAIAALMVLVFHAHPTIRINLEGYYHITSGPAVKALDLIGLYGGLGVDIFFIISGLIMSFLYLTGQERDPKEFFVKRAIRIYPVYYQALAFAWVLLLVSINKAHKDITFDYLSSFTLWPKETGTQMILAVGWTLSHELWFYTVFGLSILILKRHFLYGIGLFLLSTITYNAFAPGEPVFWLHYLNIEFCLGVFLGFFIFSTNKKEWIISGLLMIIGLLSLYHLSLYKNVAICTLCITALFALIFIEKRHNLYYPKIIILIGNASYSLYLLHIPIHKFAVKLVTIIHTNIIAYTFLALTSFILVPIICAIINYKIIELPLNRFIKNKTIKNKKTRTA